MQKVITHVYEKVANAHAKVKKMLENCNWNIESNIFIEYCVL